MWKVKNYQNVLYSGWHPQILYFQSLWRYLQKILPIPGKFFRSLDITDTVQCFHGRQRACRVSSISLRLRCCYESHTTVFSVGSTVKWFCFKLASPGINTLAYKNMSVIIEQPFYMNTCICHKFCIHHDSIWKTFHVMFHSMPSQGVHSLCWGHHVCSSPRDLLFWWGPKLKTPFSVLWDLMVYLRPPFHCGAKLKKKPF